MVEINEYELVYMAKKHDEEAISLLIEMLRPFSLKTFSKLKNNWSGFEFDDAMQYAALGVLSAVDSYRDDMETSFHSFAMVCISRSMMNYYRKIKRMSQDGYFSYYSIDRFVEDDESLTYGDALLKDYKADPHIKVHCKSVLERVYGSLDDKSIDKKVMMLKMKGYSYQEISQEIKVSKKDVDNSIQRIRKKIAVEFD